MIYVAGNQTTARINAQNAFELAKKSGKKDANYDTLKIALEAAKLKEEEAKKAAGKRGLF